MSDPNKVQNSGDMDPESVHTEGTNNTNSESNAHERRQATEEQQDEEQREAPGRQRRSWGEILNQAQTALEGVPPIPLRTYSEDIQGYYRSIYPARNGESRKLQHIRRDAHHWLTELVSNDNDGWDDIRRRNENVEFFTAPPHYITCVKRLEQLRRIFFRDNVPEANNEQPQPQQNETINPRTWAQVLEEAQTSLVDVDPIPLNNYDGDIENYYIIYPTNRRLMHLRRDVNHWREETDSHVALHNIELNHDMRMDLDDFTRTPSTRNCVRRLQNLRAIWVQPPIFGMPNNTPSNSQDEAGNDDQSTTSELTDDDVPSDESGTIEEVRAKMKRRTKLRQLICQAISNGKERQYDIVSEFNEHYHPNYIVQTLDDESRKHQDERLWEFDVDSETYSSRVEDKMEQRAKVRELIFDAIQDDQTDKESIVTYVRDSAPHYKDCYINEVLDDETVLDHDVRMWEYDGDDRTYYLCTQAPDNATKNIYNVDLTEEQRNFDAFLKRHFILMMGEDKGTNFFNSYEKLIAHNRYIQSGMNSRLQLVEHIKKLTRQMAEDAVNLEAIKDELESTTRRNAQLDRIVHRANTARAALSSDTEMSRAEYAKILRNAGLEQQLVKKDVFHIIAHANGGADHPDNYLFALGQSYNRLIGDKFDDLNCFLAGVEQATRAIEVSMRYGNAADVRNKNKPPKFYVLKHGNNPEEEAEYFVRKGQDLFRQLRVERREHDRRQQEQQSGP